MKKKTIIAALICGLILGTCSLPFLPITGHIYLGSYEKKIKLGAYDIDVRVILSDTKDDQMNIQGYFTYPAVEMIENGCILEVSVALEGYTPQEYPNHVVNTEYEKNFPKEKTRDSSIDVMTSSKLDTNIDKRRLILTLYDEPKTKQIYTLNLKPISEKHHDICSVTKVITHKAKYRRASPFDVAMSV